MSRAHTHTPVQVIIHPTHRVLCRAQRDVLRVAADAEEHRRGPQKEEEEEGAACHGLLEKGTREAPNLCQGQWMVVMFVRTLHRIDQSTNQSIGHGPQTSPKAESAGRALAGEKRRMSRRIGAEASEPEETAMLSLWFHASH